MKKATVVKPILKSAALAEKNGLCLSPSSLRKLRGRLKRVIQQNLATADAAN